MTRAALVVIVWCLCAIVVGSAYRSFPHPIDVREQLARIESLARIEAAIARKETARHAKPVL